MFGAQYTVILAEPQLGWKKSFITFKSFDIEFLPFIQQINAKEEAIRELADAATMERVRSMLILSLFFFRPFPSPFSLSLSLSLW